MPYKIKSKGLDICKYRRMRQQQMKYTVHLIKISSVLQIYQHLYHRSAGTPRKSSQSGLQPSSIHRSRDTDPSQTPEAPATSAEHMDGQHHAPRCGDTAWPRSLWMAPGHPTLPARGRQQAHHPTNPLRSNTTAHTTANAQGQEQGNSNFTCVRGAGREGRASSDLLG